MKLSDLKVDPERIEQGAWVSDIPEMGELRLKVRGLGNADYRRMMGKLIDAVPRGKRLGGRIDANEQDRLTSLCLHATVLLDWDGLTDDDGRPLPYDRDLARKLLTEPEFQRFRGAVLWAATQVAEERAAELEDASGN